MGNIRAPLPESAYVNRPYFSLIVATVLTVVAARGGQDAASLYTNFGDTLDVAMRLGLLVVGALAVRAMWQGRETARRLTGVWAVLVVTLVTAQDIAVGLFRTGAIERLLVTALLAAVVCAVTWRVRPAPTARA